MRSNPKHLSRSFIIFRGLVILFFLVGTGSPAVANGGYSLVMPLVLNGWVGAPGNITGKVSDAANPNPATNGLNGVLVCYNSTCDTTRNGGMYTLMTIPPGFMVINSSKDSYEPQSSGVIVYGNQTVTLNIAMTEQLLVADVSYRFILTWRTEPTWPPDGVENDLDSQFWMIIPPEISISSHIDPSNYRGDCTNDFPAACVERDARYGAGPETVDIRKLQENQAYRYYFGVLNYNSSYTGVPPITQSLAKIQVYNVNGLMLSLNVPTSGTGELWYAFMMDSSGTITPTNCITTIPPDPDPNHPEEPMIPPQCP